jgi:crotonobetainyl-CoA:carnitine CoA-transferase CaiB-like acyl-CoA transferase
MGAGPLTGTRVLELAVWRPGPYATQLLVQLGADVIKVEPPGGDPMRAYPGLFADINAGKRSVLIDLKTDEGRSRALELAAGADVVVEGFRPGVAGRLGVGPDDVLAINPRIIYCSLSGFGQTGPWRDVPGHDINYQALAGALTPDGGEPRLAAVPVADLAGGMAAALAVCAALAAHERGDVIDIAMADVVATWTGAVTPRARDADPGAASGRGVPGYGTFATTDGHIALGVLTEDHFWKPLCDALGLADVATLDFAARLARTTELQGAISAAIAPHQRDDLVARLRDAGVPVAPILDRTEMTNESTFRQRGAVVAEQWADPVTGAPFRFGGDPPAPRSAPPELDEHNGASW